VQKPSPRESSIGLVLLTLISFFNYLDRMVLPAVAQSIKVEFGLTDAQVGLMTGFAFVLVYAFVGIPIARLADRSNRRNILAFAVAFWSLATIACGLARSFVQLLLARMSVGIGEAACQPVGFAMIADYFPPQRRATALSWFMIGSSLGIMAGLAAGGWLGAAYGWRTAFLVVGAPGLLLALAVRLLMREPARTGLDAAAHAGTLGFAASLRVLATNRAYLWILAANVSYSMMIFGPMAWLPAFFIRTHELGMDVVGAWTGIGIGIGMALGMAAGGPWADRLLRGGRHRPLLLCAAASLVTAPAYAYAFWAAKPELAFAATLIAAGVGALSAPTNIAALLGACDPRLRATAAAFLQILTGLLGAGLTPYAIGLLSDHLAPTVGVDSLRWALTAALITCFLAAFGYWRSSVELRRA
jgi:predicted MFS family arabinose efflux permease